MSSRAREDLPAVPTVAALERAWAAGDVEPWLEKIPDEGARARLRRALHIDRVLLEAAPASLGSYLYARTLGEAALKPLVAAWESELDARGAPWAKALRPMSLPAGLVAELHLSELLPGVTCADADIDALPLQQIALGERAVLEVSFRRSTAPSGEVVERLRCAWRGATTDAATAPRPPYPKLTSNGWGPISLVRTAGADPIELPCPEEGSARAHFTGDGERLFVYGTLEDYDGGFAMQLDPRTLEVQLSLDTEEQVLGGSSCDRPEVLLVECSRERLLWSGGQLHALAIADRDAALSPDGNYLAVHDYWGSERIEIWSIAELLAAGAEPPQRGFPTSFDPTGDRLVSERTLYHGHTGEAIAPLDPWFGHSLVGGPPLQPYHCSERFIINLSTFLELWDTRTGATIPPFRDVEDSSPRRFHRGDMLAFDTRGLAFAVISRFQRSRVQLYPLPADGTVQTIAFGLEAQGFALSGDASLIAVQGPGPVEVRSRTGELVGSWDWLHPRPEIEDFVSRTSLRFSRDGDRLACEIPGGGWQIWSFAGSAGDQVLATRDELETLADFAALPRTWAALRASAEWIFEAGTRTLLTHLPSGTRIALPAAGPWVRNPADPCIAASPSAHVELRAPRR